VGEARVEADPDRAVLAGARVLRSAARVVHGTQGLSARPQERGPGVGEPDRPIVPVGAIGSAALIWPFIWALSSGDIVLVFVVGILLSGVVCPAYGGVGFAMFAEQSAHGCGCPA
jgi:hypothetical protein